MQQVGVFLLLPLIGGFLFVRGCYLTKFLVQREDGHRLYFRAAYFGALLFFAAALIRLCLAQVDFLSQLDGLVVKLVAKFVQDAPPNAFNASFVTTCVYALGLGHAYHLLNLKLDHVWRLERAVAEYGTDLDIFLYRSIKDEASIMVTLDNGKVYIGFATSVPKSARDKTDMGLLPLLSGHRNEPDMRLVPTTNYSAVYQDLPPGQKTRVDFEIVIPISRIVTCGRFDFEAYKKFNPNAGEMLARLANASKGATPPVPGAPIAQPEAGPA